MTEHYFDDYLRVRKENGLVNIETRSSKNQRYGSASNITLEDDEAEFIADIIESDDQ